MTTFKGHKTGFNATASNDVTPNFMGPPSTKFEGRPAVPAGPLKNYPGEVANISDKNRRLGKANHGAGAGAGLNFRGDTAFSKKSPKGGGARTYNTGGGIGSGICKGK